MDKIEITKMVVSTVVGAGTAKIVGAIIRNNTDPETLVDKVTIGSAQFVIGSMAADISKRYTDIKIDQIVNFVNENLKQP